MSRGSRLACALSCVLVLAVPARVVAVPAEGMRGMVSSAHPLASAAGVEMLRKGGNAVDAAVATAFALAVCEPSASGLGGGGFSLSRMNGRLEFLDFREVAPAAARREMFVRGGVPEGALSRDGALAAGVPGAVAGYLELHRRHGKLPRDVVLAPAIELAEKGFRANERYLYYVVKRKDRLLSDPESARIFLQKSRAGTLEPPQHGALVVQKDLAKTLAAISRDGAPAFYTGDVAKLLVADMKARGGLITAADLAAYTVRERKPLLGRFLGHTIATAPPPSAGGHIVLSILAGVESLPPGTPRHDLRYLHRYIEISRRAYADRMLFGDPAFTPDPTPQLTNHDRIVRIVDALGPKATPHVDPGEGTPLRKRKPGAKPPHEGANTTHLCAMDADGNTVSLTTTINFWFGAGIVAKGTGVIWNDEMDDFSIGAGVMNAWQIEGSEANAPGPGRIPLSSMSPTIVFEKGLDSPVRLVVGAPGGPRIPMQVAAAIYAHLALGQDVQTSLATPKIHAPWSPDVLQFERFALDRVTQAALRKLGYVLEEEPDHRRWGNGTAIAVDPATGLRTGASDPRGAGSAAAE